MTDWNGFKGAAIRATESDIAAIAAGLGVPYFRLRGVIEVEAPKGPFDAKGRPAMLFEPYWFYRKLPKAKQAAAVKAGVAATKRPASYPSDSYPVLAKAMAFDETAALESCSWGRGQVMGFNFAAAGFASVQEMVSACMGSEAGQLRAMAGFIKANGLVKHLKSGNAAGFALGYNGEGYAREGYDAKIIKGWAKWQAKGDPLPAGGLTMPAAPKPPEPITDKKTVELVQGWLKNVGYNEVGTPDGDIGKLTKAGIRAFRAENGLPDGDFIDNELIVALAKAEPRKLAPERANATPAEVRAVVPEAHAAWTTKLMAGGASIVSGGAALGGGILDNVSAAKGYIDPLKELANDVPGWAWLAVVFVVAAILWRVAGKGEAAAVAAVQTGARR